MTNKYYRTQYLWVPSHNRTGKTLNTMLNLCDWTGKKSMFLWNLNTTRTPGVTCGSANYYTGRIKNLKLGGGFWCEFVWHSAIIYKFTCDTVLFWFSPLISANSGLHTWNFYSDFFTILFFTKNWPLFWKPKNLVSKRVVNLTNKFLKRSSGPPGPNPHHPLWIRHCYIRATRLLEKEGQL